MSNTRQDKNFSKIPDDVLRQLESFAEDIDMPVDVVIRNYLQILKYFDGSLKYYQALTEFQNHYFRKNRKKYRGLR